MRLSIFCVVLVLLFSATSKALAQCEQKIEITTEVLGDTGKVTVRLGSVENYYCVLYAYEEGKKNKIADNTGSGRLIEFEKLEQKVYYKIEITFNERKERLCQSWISEVIQINK